MLKNLVLWLVIALVLMSVFSNFGPPQKQVTKLAYSQFLEKVKSGDIKKITVEDKNVNGVTQDDKPFATYIPSKELPESVINVLTTNGAIVVGKAPEQPSLLMNIFVSWFPIILFIGVWIFFMRQMQGGGGGRGAMSFG
ncbi:MAG TPA: ATP-dependent metallopeptidase FtsH/Yme1/Tma family protein, partial [Gammaproteobacteria bacterium]|nr:ATP-dependent metallopeptidase FtsH/Yme1/Tma family protein [Gammaproteobacteria bacterium]